MKKVLILADCPGWAIDKLVNPLAENIDGVDIAYHFTDGKPKHTGFNVGDHEHINVDTFKRNYDIYHFNSHGAARVCLRMPDVLKVMEGKKVIMFVHTEADIEEMLEWSEFKRVDLFVVPTKYLARKMEEAGRNYIYLDHHIDTSAFPYVERLTGQYVGFNGRTMRHKRLKEIVNASGSMDYPIRGVGYVDDGEYWHSIMKTEYDFTLGMVSQSDLAEYMSKNFKILVSISTPHIETGTLGVLECCSLGIPILTTPTGWAVDNLNDKSALFIPEREINKLPEYIDQLMTDGALREKLRINARKIVEQHDIKDYIKKWEEIYETI